LLNKVPTNYFLTKVENKDQRKTIFELKATFISLPVFCIQPREATRILLGGWGGLNNEKNLWRHFDNAFWWLNL